MARTSLLYGPTGDVIGYVFCSNDAAMDANLPLHERIVEVPNDHDAVRNPGAWKVEIRGGRPEVSQRPGPPEDRGRP